MGCKSTGLGWIGNQIGVNQAPREVAAKKEKIRIEIKFFRSGAGNGLVVKRSFFFSPIKRMPKNGVRVRLAQNAKRSYVNHSQALPKKMRGRGVVPPSPSRKRMVNEMSKPRKRRCHLRKRNGIIARSGPYNGKKKMASASRSVKKL